MWFNESPELAEFKCPITGRDLWNYGNRMDVMDGPTTYMTEDFLFIYEKWPRDWGTTLYLVQDRFPEGKWPTLDTGLPKYVRRRFFRLQDDKTWKSYYDVHGTDVPTDHPMLLTYCSMLHAQYLVEQRLREIEYDRWAKENEGKSGGLASPMARRVFSNTIASELVIVQPMEAPQGMLMYLDYRYTPSMKARRRFKLPTWLWRVTKAAHSEGEGMPGYMHDETRYKLFGITIWKEKQVYIS